MNSSHTPHPATKAHWLALTAVLASSMSILPAQAQSYDSERARWEAEHPSVARTPGMDYLQADQPYRESSNRMEHMEHMKHPHGMREDYEHGDMHARREQTQEERREWEGAHQYHRGGMLPSAWRDHSYRVDNWHEASLHRPARGYHWVQAGADYLLVSNGTNRIAEVFAAP